MTLEDLLQTHRFDLRRVTWGYRELFRRMLSDLVADGHLLEDPDDEVSRLVFDTLRTCQHRTSTYDQVLKEFLSALHGKARWLMGLPGLFEDWLDLGRRLAEIRQYHGIRYFDLWARGCFGDDPQEIRQLLGQVRLLMEVDAELAFSYLQGYPAMRAEVPPERMRHVVDEGLAIFSRNPDSAKAFFRVELKSSRVFLQSLSRECRLEDIKPRLANLFLGLTGTDAELDNLGGLDSDELIERGARVVCMVQWLYLPARIRDFDTVEKARQVYMLMTAFSAGCHVAESFPRLQGVPGLGSSEDLLRRVLGADGPRALWLFHLVEYCRVSRVLYRQFPGVRRLLNHGAELEYDTRPVRGAIDAILQQGLTGRPINVGDDAFAYWVEQVVTSSRSCFDTARRLPEGLEVFASHVGARPPMSVRIPFFVPDFQYPAEVNDAGTEQLALSLEQDALQSQPEDTDRDEQDNAPSLSDSETTGDEADEDETEQGKQVGFFYDEWNVLEQDYYENWCCLREKVPRVPEAGVTVPEKYSEEAAAVRRMFERIKADEVRRVKRLADGDEIDHDLLLDYLVSRRSKTPGSDAVFVKPLVKQRDFAVAVLVDASGSTSETVDDRRVIDLEKEAAFILAEGLHSLGDDFALYGFTGNGREACEFYLYKDFDQDWQRTTRRRLMAATPGSSTRIGVALRHTGARMRQNPSRRKLIILITDGKPMDSGYDPSTRYAQHDVRKACEENERLGIATFCISTDENTRSELELMFPARRFVILDTLKHLPSVLSSYYLHLTR